MECVDRRPELIEAKSPSEDWTGLRSRAERRKLQTRLNVRAHRRRKAEAAKRSTDTVANTRRNSNDNNKTADQALVIPAYFTADARLMPARRLFPLSLDHLLPLVQYNVFRASITNVHLTQSYHLLTTNCAYTYGTLHPAESVPQSAREGSLNAISMTLFLENAQGHVTPPTLRPTALQKSTPHPGWIDIMPCAMMRDNAVRLADLVDIDDLCSDLLPSLTGAARDDEAGLVAWSNPWEPAGWEVKPGFARKWWFLIEGCVEMMRATNHYRALRGERPIVW